MCFVVKAFKSDPQIRGWSLHPFVFSFPVVHWPKKGGSRGIQELGQDGFEGQSFVPWHNEFRLAYIGTGKLRSYG